jgi:branched-chain amino acid transport system substrate-binding protein
MKSRPALRRRWLTWLSVGIVPVVVLSACSSSSKSKTTTATTAAAGGSTATTAAGGTTASSLDTSNPYVYLLSDDFTGALQQFTQAEQIGIEAGIKVINSEGGILGREVVLQTQNDQNDPTTAVNLLQQRLSSGKKTDAIYPGGSSAVSLALEPVLTQNKILATDATSSDALNVPAKYPYFFGVSTLASTPVPSFIAALQSKGYKKIGMIFANNATGQTTEASFSKGIKAAGLGFTSVSYSQNSLDMTPQLQQLKAAGVDAVIYNSFGTDTLYIIKSRNQMGWNTEPFYADQTAAAYAYSKNFQPADLKNVFIQTSNGFLAGGVEVGWTLLHNFIDTVKTESGGPAELLANGAGLAAVGYNAIMMAKLGVTLANSTDADAVKTALENISGKMPSPFPFLSFGPTAQFGNYSYSTTNHFPTLQPTAFAYVTPGSYNADGLYVPGGS